MGIHEVDLDNISLDDANFCEGDLSKIIIHVKRLAWHIKLKQHKAFKKEMSKELMPVAWHSMRWRDWCMLEDKKRSKSIFY